MEKIEFNSGQFIFKAGDDGGSMFLLASGVVGIFLPANATDKPNFLVEDKEIFGEMGVIEDSLRSAHARCMEDCVVIKVSKKEFNKKLDETDLFVKGLLRVLSTRLRETQKPKTLSN